LTTLLACACGGDDGGPTDPNPNPNPNPDPEFGHIQVSTTTAGADLDVDGYTVKMGGAADRSIGLNGVTTFSDVAVGSHQVELTGIADNCSANGSSPATAAVTKDATAQVSFDVECEALPIGSLEVTTTVTNNFDPDGFQVFVDGVNQGGVEVDGSATFDDLPSGSQPVELFGIAPNCEVDGENPASVTIPTGGAATASFSVTCTNPPDGRIVYTGNVGGRFGVAVMNSDGTGQMLIWEYPPSAPGNGVWRPRWSPDGSSIAFESEHDGPHNLYIINKDGSGVRRLTEYAESDGRVEWSPDGNRLLFTRRWYPIGEPLRTALYVVNADGTGLQEIPRESAAYREERADWSPDGTQIVFVARAEDRRDMQGIFVMNADGTDAVQITVPVPVCAADGWPQWVDSEPQWSPDGSRIALTRNHGCEPDESNFEHDILLMDPDGTDIVNITNWPEWQTDPRWSPDGSKFVYDGGNWSIHTINADGSGHVAIIPTSNVSAQDPDWGP
jgi:TolB protein